jgi:hypothetical protein
MRRSRSHVRSHSSEIVSPAITVSPLVISDSSAGMVRRGSSDRLLSSGGGKAVHPISWRQEFGGLKSDQIKRLKELETENSRLCRAVSDLTLGKLILQEVARGPY